MPDANDPCAQFTLSPNTWMVGYDFNDPACKTGGKSGQSLQYPCDNSSGILSYVDGDVIASATCTQNSNCQSSCTPADGIFHLGKCMPSTGSGGPTVVCANITNTAPPGPHKFRCRGPPDLSQYQCELSVDNTGQYEKFDDCQKQCNANPSPTPPPKFWCNTSDHQCRTGNGPPGSVTYPTFAGCRKVCDPPATQMYSCVNRGCVKTQGGVPLDECQSTCGKSYICNNGVCTLSIHGGVSLDECQDTCGKSYICNNGVCTVSIRGGDPYDTCIENCTPSKPPSPPPGKPPGTPPKLYSCNASSGQCQIVAEGGVPWKNCIAMCHGPPGKPPGTPPKLYSCNASSGQCQIVAEGGVPWKNCVAMCHGPPGGAPGSSDDDGNKWWVWVILGVLILAIVGVLLWTFGVFGSAVAGGGRLPRRSKRTTP